MLAHPFEGKFYDYRDSKVPVLRATFSEDVVLTLPPGLSSQDIKWISVWCRKFAVDFGHAVVDPANQGERYASFCRNREEPSEILPVIIFHRHSIRCTHT